MTGVVLQKPGIEPYSGPCPPWISKNRPMFRVIRSMVYRAANGVIYTVPVGYITDLASIPRIVWALISPHGELLITSMLHDWLYSHAAPFYQLNKLQVDQLFSECARVTDVAPWKVKASYAAVRVGGRGGWANGFHKWPTLTA